MGAYDKDSIRVAFRALRPDMDAAYEENVPLSQCCTFHIGGPADFLFRPKSACELKKICRTLSEIGCPFYLIGNGSNVLFDDDGYRGAVILTTSMRTLTKKDNIVRADCGVMLTRLAKYACSCSLSGAQFTYGIPGTVGGGIYMNAGAYGGEMSQIVHKSAYYDTESGNIGVYNAAEHDFSYRHSIYGDGKKIILSAWFEFDWGDPAEIKTTMDEYMRRRTQKQPLEYPSAGSVFKRYPGYFTAALIDEAGLKGCSVGGAQVSEKHAGFIINRGGATCEDVRRLIDIIKTKIYEKNHIEIECEIKMVDNDKAFR